MTVFFRTTGTMKGPAFFLKRRGGGLTQVRMPVTVAVLERPEGIVLIDTGWSRRVCAWPDVDPGRAAKFFLGLDVRPEDALASQLLSLGYVPADVRHIVATHLHIDHVSGAVDFPLATVHCTEAEWEALRRKGWSYDRRVLELPRVACHVLRGPSVLGFPACHDLFGDGTVLLLDTCGHTAGSLSVAVKLQSGWLLHVGDAAMFAEDYRMDDTAPASLYMRTTSWDLVEQRSSGARIRAAEREHGAVVVPSHDLGVYEGLPRNREDAWKGAWGRAGKVRPTVKRS